VSRLPPLRVPRPLLDPLRDDLGPADSEALVAVEIEVERGHITALRSCPDAGGAPLAFTPAVEPHAHLDKAYTAGDHPNPEGTMAGALAANRREMEQRRHGDVRRRAERALERAWRQGLRAIRSHVDSLGPGAAASWRALGELREEWRGRVDLQLVALVPLGHWGTAGGEQLAVRVARAGGLLGGVLGDPYAAAASDHRSLLQLLRLARHHQCGVDLHVDESDHDPGRGLRRILRALASEPVALPLPLTCSHSSSMGLLPDGPCRRLAAELAARDVAVVALPTTNLWLLGKRTERTPHLRPQAPIRQLQQEGVTVAVGGDNVEDPWFPAGDFDPLALIRFCLTSSHLLPWQRQGLAPFTTAAARLLGLGWDGVLRLGAPADLVVVGSGGWREALCGERSRRVLRAGRWLPPVSPQPLPPPLEGMAG
jgi:cytosine deaminase